MADEPKDGELSLNVSELEFSARGRAYEDLRPIIKTGAATIANVLQVLENAVGIPCDFANYHLKRFRIRYQEGVEAIPEEFRELPPFRLGCTVMREVLYAAEEPALQELFASLLITGSDTRTNKTAHPGFASTINQLTWHDAEMLIYLKNAKWQHDLDTILSCNDGERVITPIVLTNLHRLGLLEWQYHGAASMSPDSLSTNFGRDVAFYSRSDYSRGELGGIDITPGLQRATEGLVSSLAVQLEEMHLPVGVTVTEYGKDFVNACLTAGIPASPEEQVP